MGNVERGLYGRGKTIKNWDSYSPNGAKTTPFPTEKVCALCESKCDVIFPLSPKLCQRCTKRILGRQDVMRRMKGALDLGGYHCDYCGGLTYMPTTVNTRACNRCTIRLGNQTKQNQIQRMAGARHVF